MNVLYHTDAKHFKQLLALNCLMYVIVQLYTELTTYQAGCYQAEGAVLFCSLFPVLEVLYEEPHFHS